MSIQTACGGSSPSGTPGDHPSGSPGGSDSSSGGTPPGSLDDGGDAGMGEPDAGIDPKYTAWAGAFDAERASLGIPGCSVAVLEKGQVAFSRGFGTKGLGSSDPVDDRTLYRIGSNTKALTALAVLRLVDDGKVNLDAAVTTYIPNLAIGGTYLASLTIRDLLTHQSGLSDDGVFDTAPDDSALLTYFTSSQVSQTEYFMDPPGTFYNYSNSNFMLAGLVAEQVGGVHYRQAMHDRVFAPLGMTRTFFLPSEAIADGDVSAGVTDGSYGNPAGPVKVDAYDNAYSRPAGFAFASVLDYARFLGFLYAGNTSVLSSTQHAAMQGRQVDTREAGDIASYGFGIENDSGFYLGSDYYTTTLITHGGLIPGYESNYFLLPASGWGIVVFCNSDVHFPDSSFAQSLRDLAPLPAPSTPPTNVNPDPSTYPQIAGSFYDPNYAGHVSIAATASGLSIAMPDMDAANIPYDKTLTPAWIDDFTFKFYGLDTEVTFLKDASGAYTWMRSRGFVAKRGP
jgi:CubicO group peptidase (beta-lactamase class C family)